MDRSAPLKTFALYANCALQPLRLIPLASNSHSPQTILSKNIFKLHKIKFFKHGIFIKTASFFISLSNFWEISLQVNKRKVNIIFFLLLHREQLLMEPIYTKDMKEKCGQQTHCINQVFFWQRLIAYNIYNLSFFSILSSSSKSRSCIIALQEKSSAALDPF